MILRGDSFSYEVYEFPPKKLSRKKTFDDDTNTTLHWLPYFTDAGILSETMQVPHYRYHIPAIPDATVYKSGFD